jgi:flagellar biosynthesis/type III secretory pathway ATPase
MGHVTGDAHGAAAAKVRSALAVLAETADVRSLGLPLSDPRALRAQAAEARIESFLRQGEISIKPGAMLEELVALADSLEERPWISQPT